VIWLQFALSAAIIVVAAVKLAEYGDALAYRTGAGGLFVGSLLLAGATSLPEMLTMVSAIHQGHINLTAGDLFGSSMFNMFLLGLLDVSFYQTRVLRRVALNHALTASLGTLLTGLAVFFIVADIELPVAWVGVDSLVMIAAYVAGVWLIRRNPLAGRRESVASDVVQGLPSLRRAVIGFAGTALVLAIVTPSMVRSGSGIAQRSGLGDSFVGMAMIAIVTSLPELVAMVSAMRLGAYDMAVGNLFGSNVFNMFALASGDILYTQGSFLGAIDPVFALAGLLAMLLTTLGLVGNLAQTERRIIIVEADAALLILSYFAGMWLLYTRGIGG